MKKNFVIEGTTKDVEKAIAVLTAMGLSIIEDNATAKTTKAQPKVEAKTKAKTSSKKKSDNFDRALYESIAKELGVLGNHGVSKACRPTVYKVMDGSLSKAKAKKEVEAWKKSNPWATK